MTTNELIELPYWFSKPIVFFYQLMTVAMALWRRRSRGVAGGIECVRSICKQLMQVSLAELCFGARAGIIASAYAWAMRIDDVADGLVCPPKHASREEYVKWKRILLVLLMQKNKVTALPARMEDILLVDIFRSAEKLGIDVNRELQGIWDAFQYDFERLHRYRILTSKELVQHARERDRAITALGTKALGGNGTRAQEIVGAYDGVFIRIDHLFDILDDVQQGIVNIPKEAIEFYEIDVAELSRCSTWKEALAIRPFRAWYGEEVKKISDVWMRAKIACRLTIGTVFTSPFLCWFVQKLIFGIFNGALKSCERRLADS